MKRTFCLSVLCGNNRIFVSNINKKGAGNALYKALFSELKFRNIHSVMCGITLPNDASIALHEKFGMVKVAHFAEVGFKFNQWLEVGY